VCLSCRSLLDRIWDRKDLTHVYPDAPKSEIFPHKIEAGVPKYMIYFYIFLLFINLT